MGPLDAPPRARVVEEDDRYSKGGCRATQEENWPGDCISGRHELNPTHKLLCQISHASTKSITIGKRPAKTERKTKRRPPSPYHQLYEWRFDSQSLERHFR